MRGLVESLLAVPHKPGGSGRDGADCWGIAEIWYRERHGIALADRAAHDASPLGVAAGFALAAQWLPVEVPRNDDLIVMRAPAPDGAVLDHGHVGVWFDGRVIHSAPGHGCVCQPWADRRIRPRVTAILRHRDLA